MSISTRYFTRLELRKIYEKLSNTDKNKWAVAANYRASRGLNQYLSNNPNGLAYPRVVEALLNSNIVTDSFIEEILSTTDNFQQEGHQSSEVIESWQTLIQGIADEKTPIITGILKSVNIPALQNTKKLFEDLSIAINNQLERMALIGESKKSEGN